MRLKRKWQSDWEGRPLQVGDEVRVCAIPSFTGMSKRGISESLPVFRYALGRTFAIRDFDDFGCAAMDSAIPVGPHRGMHGIYVEVALLKLVRRSATARSSTRITSRSTRSRVKRAPG